MNSRPRLPQWALTLILAFLILTPLLVAVLSVLSLLPVTVVRSPASNVRHEVTEVGESRVGTVSFGQVAGSDAPRLTVDELAIVAAEIDGPGVLECTARLGEEVVKLCRNSAAECGSLPHSAKGYELYSWYAEEEEEWYHVLSTGTNRLKTYDEVRFSENVIVGDWVKLSALGTEELKVLLSRLPAEEYVTWIGREWLQRVLVPPGSIQLPDGEVIDEIQDYCHQLGLRLQITD